MNKPREALPFFAPSSLLTDSLQTDLAKRKTKPPPRSRTHRREEGKKERKRHSPSFHHHPKISSSKHPCPLPEGPFPFFLFFLCCRLRDRTACLPRSLVLSRSVAFLQTFLSCLPIRLSVCLSVSVPLSRTAFPPHAGVRRSVSFPSFLSRDRSNSSSLLT